MSRIVVRRLLAFVACGGSLAAAAITPAQAHATPLTFLQSLNNYGIVVYDATAALTTGYAICAALDGADGEQVAQQIYTHTTYADVPDMPTARMWVIVSVEQLCERHDHRGQVA